MRWEPTNANCPIRTRRSPRSSISETEAHQFALVREFLLGAIQMQRIDAVDDLADGAAAPPRTAPPARFPALPAAACGWCRTASWWIRSQALSQRSPCRSIRSRISSATARLGWVSLSWMATADDSDCEAAIGAQLSWPGCPAARRRRRNTPGAAEARGRPAFSSLGYRNLQIASARACAATGADIIAGVEGFHLQGIGRALGAPQPQRIDVAAAPADDRGVIGDGAARSRPAARPGAVAAFVVGTGRDAGRRNEML